MPSTGLLELVTARVNRVTELARGQVSRPVTFEVRVQSKLSDLPVAIPSGV